MNEELLQRIGNAPGVPGFESEVQTIIAKELADCCDEVRADHMGNVIGIKRATSKPDNGQRPVRLMLAAHCDEPAMMLKHITDKGFIHLITCGGVSPVIMQSQRVVIHGKEKVRGVIAPSFKKDGASTPIDDLLIDTGMPKDWLEERVSPGDPITVDEDTSRLNGKVWVGRNFDNRIGSYTMTQAMRELGDTPVDVYAVSSVQEEVGLRGARAAAFGVAPDIGIAIDGSMARQAYGSDKGNLCEPGQGTGIYIRDNLTIGHPKLVKHMFEVCKQRGIAHQGNIGGGTDAAAMQQSRAGVIATTIGAPVRYMHATGQLCHADDMDATVALLVAMCETGLAFYDSLMDPASCFGGYAKPRGLDDGLDGQGIQR